MEIIIPEYKESSKLDLLDRQSFIERMLTIANAFSDNKKNACYAVNGDWGVGKSFVLDMFEDQAKVLGVEGEELPRYLLLRYNCWEYDYYEEPLVAIVASILDQIDEKVDLLPADIKGRIVAALEAVGKGLVKKAIQVIDEKTGVNLQEAAEIIKDGAAGMKNKVMVSHDYDQYFDFKKNLKKLQETIASLSENQTVIFIVDELDRCLPEYTIKVLERLHHLFNEIPNVQVILSIDAGQLEYVVRQIYGEGTDAKKYLRKFIQFELKLNEGTIKDHFEERFMSYLQRFEIQSRSTSAVDVEEFKSYILEGMDMRNRILVIDKCTLLHTLLCKEDKVDSSYMCLEMLLVILSSQKINLQYAKSSFSISSVFSGDRLWLNSERRTVPKGLKDLSDRYSINRTSNTSRHYILSFNKDEQCNVVNTDCLLGALLSAYRKILGFEDDCWVDTIRSNTEYVEYACKYWDLLQIIN